MQQSLAALRSQRANLGGCGVAMHIRDEASNHYMD